MSCKLQLKKEKKMKKGTKRGKTCIVVCPLYQVNESIKRKQNVCFMSFHADPGWVLHLLY